MKTLEAPMICIPLPKEFGHWGLQPVSELQSAERSHYLFEAAPAISPEDGNETVLGYSDPSPFVLRVGITSEDRTQSPSTQAGEATAQRKIRLRIPNASISHGGPLAHGQRMANSCATIDSLGESTETRAISVKVNSNPMQTIPGGTV